MDEAVKLGDERKKALERFGWDFVRK